ncbi:MAG TPA: Uma2 family endonuclease [Chloroflexota bacterium]|nr:Uma2 family endonuclease [Chloroflexota bacterium]
MSVAVRKRKRNSAAEPSPWPLVIRTRPALDVSEEQFYEFCQLNGDLRIERSAVGEWLIMPPTGGDTGHRNAEITYQLVAWAKQDGTGVAYDSSTGFRLPNGAMRSPDGAWLRKDRLAAISPEDRQRFMPICPDFVLELWSPSDRLADVQAKMDEYLANGGRLGWLLYPPERCVYVYRPEAPVERLDQPETVSGEPVLSGFALDLREIW